MGSREALKNIDQASPGLLVCATCAGANFSVLAFKISALGHKLVIICAIRVEEKLGVLAFKISVLRQKIVIIFATRAEANLGGLAFKISFTSKSSLFLCNFFGCKFTRFSV